MRTRILTLILLQASAPLLASGSSWLAYPRSARNVAEAGGLGVMARGLNALALNAAGLADEGAKGRLQASHSSWPAGISAEHLGASMRAPWGGVAALSGTWVDFGSVQGYRRGADGTLTETQALRPNAAAVEGAWAHGSPSLQFGLGVSALRQDLGAGGDLSPSLEAGLKGAVGGGFSLGASVLNLGARLGGSALPTEARLGAAWSSSGRGFELGVELADQSRLARRPDLYAALRLRLAEGFGGQLGWQQLEGAQAQLSAGLSFEWGANWGLDYGYRQQSDLGGSHHLGLGLRWG